MSSNYMFDIWRFDYKKGANLNNCVCDLLRNFKDHQHTMTITIPTLTEHELMKIIYDFERFLVMNYYRMMLNRPVNYTQEMTPYGKSTISFEDDLNPMDLDLIWDEEVFIDIECKKIFVPGLVIWLFYLRLLHEFYNQTEPELYEKTPNKPFDADNLVTETIAMMNIQEKLTKEIYERLEETFMKKMAILARYVTLSPVEVPYHTLRSSLELFVHTKSMIDPQLIFPKYDIKSELGISNERIVVLQETMEYFIDEWKPEPKIIEIVKRFLTVLTSFPNIQWFYIYSELYKKPEDFLNTQYMLHFQKAIRRKLSAVKFKSEVINVISSFNPDEHGIEYFYKKTAYATPVSEAYKLTAMHYYLTNYMFFDGFVPLAVINNSQILQTYEYIMKASFKTPFIYEIAPNHYSLLKNGIPIPGTAEECILGWLDHVDGVGYDNIRNFEERPNVYYWLKALPSFIKDEIVYSSLKKGKAKIVGKRKQSTTPLSQPNPIQTVSTNSTIPSNSSTIQSKSTQSAPQTVNVTLVNQPSTTIIQSPSNTILFNTSNTINRTENNSLSDEMLKILRGQQIK